MDKLSSGTRAKLLLKIAEDFSFYMEKGTDFVPAEQTFIVPTVPDITANVSARIAAFTELSSSGFEKKAFDTRRIDQETERNPRGNLQYWNRSQAFIEEADSKKLKTFSKLGKVLDDVRTEFGKEPEWFDSYARQLYDNVNRILRIKQADLDIFKPQMSYIEQLISMRYHISLDDIDKRAEESIRDTILGKDEALLKRGEYLRKTAPERSKTGEVQTKNGLEKTTQDSIVNAIFGSDKLRKDGERTVERTITITIRDNVID